MPSRRRRKETDSPIAQPLLTWHERKGRHDLPWGANRTPYRVWVSEIMLQQTQVTTVRPYFERFLARFPDVRALAASGIDEVLHLWSGLGYYARARNLHRAANLVCAELGGEFPRSVDGLMRLPGIGRSTAGAILALSCGERCAILDGNVRRVLSRYFGVEGGKGTGAGTKRLWALAERCTPAEEVARYTQAIMDLGATVCVRARPLCECCPLKSRCIARRTGRQQELPAARTARPKRIRSVFMVVALQQNGSVLLERRPESGVWGGLWCLPQFDTASAARTFIRQTLSASTADAQHLSTLEHAFTHFSLVIKPLLVRCLGPAEVQEGTSVWYNIRTPARLGLPAPVSALLDRLGGGSMFDQVS